MYAKLVGTGMVASLVTGVTVLNATVGVAVVAAGFALAIILIASVATVELEQKTLAKRRVWTLRIVRRRRKN
jgi:hypothetical protein